MVNRMDEIKPGYTRVSEISSAFAGYGRIPQDVLDKAAARGSQVHELIFDYLNDVPIPEDKWSFNGESLKGYFESFLQFWNHQEVVEIILQEERFYNDTYMITGKPDVVIRKKSFKQEYVDFIVDWKCTSTIGRHWDIQAAGYAVLLNEGYSLRSYPALQCKSMFVKLKKDGNYPDLECFPYDPHCFYKAWTFYKQYFENLKCNLELE